MREELAHSNVKGRNPFKDARVRRAFYQAIDIETIKTKVMRGMASSDGPDDLAAAVLGRRQAARAGPTMSPRPSN